MDGVAQKSVKTDTLNVADASVWMTTNCCFSVEMCREWQGEGQLYNHQINKSHVINSYYNQMKLLLMLISCHMNWSQKKQTKTKQVRGLNLLLLTGAMKQVSSWQKALVQRWPKPRAWYGRGENKRLPVLFSIKAAGNTSQEKQHWSKIANDWLHHGAVNFWRGH